MSEAVTQGVRVSVKSSYIADQSAPRQQRYVFAYTVRITNEGKRPVQLVSRHWVITHGSGRVEEVRGPGVVGAQPRLEPGQHFEYTSGCVLSTPHGAMHGSYEMRARRRQRVPRHHRPVLTEHALHAQLSRHCLGSRGRGSAYSRARGTSGRCACALGHADMRVR